MSRAGKNSFKRNDYYTYYRCIKPLHDSYNMDKNKYFSILNDIFDGLFDVIVAEGSIDLPYRLGSLFLRRIETKPKMVDGKMVYVAPVDWEKTKNL